ncbi:iron chaperone [Niabella hibiscisoli]|uniref:iron chaperone n=1 Tax=Niabella hibiscisoli TaxID=1825928 RepID=UPI00374D552F
MSKPVTIEEYLATIPVEALETVNKIRQVISKAAPKAEEGLSYGIGGFKQNGKYFIYYSGYKKHTSIYPAPRGHEDFEEELSNYKGGKGTVQLPLDKPLPTALIKRIVLFRLRENEERTGIIKRNNPVIPLRPACP